MPVACSHRGNAIKWLVTLISSVQINAPATRIVELQGGDKRNALPRDAVAVLAIPEQRIEDAKVSSFMWMWDRALVSKSGGFLLFLYGQSGVYVLVCVLLSGCGYDFIRWPISRILWKGEVSNCYIGTTPRQVQASYPHQTVTHAAVRLHERCALDI